MNDLFYKRFREMLKEFNYTYDDLKDKLGIKSKGTIAKYNNGDIENLPFSIVEKMAEVFGVSPAWLVGWIDEKYYEIKK